MAFESFASHIVGGEIVYDHLGKDGNGNDLYRITLRIYRDCSSSIQFDNPALLSVTDTNGEGVTTTFMGSPAITKIPPSINSTCIKTPDYVCVEEGVYTTTLALPPRPGGYFLIYTVCCRNNSLTNLLSPGSQSSSYFTKIPGPEDALINNSPRFKKFPPLFLCANFAFSFDHSAVDPDGDLLKYSLTTPFQGPPPANQTVNYVAPYSGTNPFTSNPSIAIDSLTGRLTCKPVHIGQFVVGICAREYRNGKLINTHFRDFQFNIEPCAPAVSSRIKEQNVWCQGNTISFTNLSTAMAGTPSARWDFGVPSLSSDTSLLFHPSYTYADTGKYLVTLIANPGQTCADTTKQNIYVYPPLDISFAAPPKQCLTNNSFTFQTLGEHPFYTTFLWDFTSAADPPVSMIKNPANVVFSDSGFFRVKLRAQFLTCRDSFTDLVHVPFIQPAKRLNWDTTIVIGEKVKLNAFSGPAYRYSWTPFIGGLTCEPCNTHNPVADVISNTSYTVEIEDTLHCAVTKNVYRIFIEKKASIDVPTAFTPNGDGINDIVCPDGWGIKKLNHFKVFNRWGQLLFESHDLKSGWNGDYNGLPQNAETYIYVVSVETYLDEKPELQKTGTFKLIR